METTTLAETLKRVVVTSVFYGQFTLSDSLKVKLPNTLFTLEVKPAQSEPDYRMGPPNWSIKQIGCISLVRKESGADKAGLTVAV